MLKNNSFKIAGVDGCKIGWFVVCSYITNKRCVFKNLNFFTAKTFVEVVSKTTDCKLICVDIPIGLSNGPEPRQCDIEARKLLGRPRASSVFPPPIRRCLWTNDYKTASKICLKYSGKKLNKQSFFLLDKIRQVDELMTPALQNRIREIHPEILFWALNNYKPLKHSKKNLRGRKERINLLSTIIPNLQKLLDKAHKPKQVERDDILDALVATLTASQTVIEKAQTIPENPLLDNKSLKMEILYPLP